MTLEPWKIQEIAEGLDFEVKKAAGRDGMGQLPDSFWETYSAMANAEGGVVLLGVEEKADGTFAAHGIANVKKVTAELWNGLNNREKVSRNILNERDVTVSELGGKKVIQIHIPRAARGQMPVFLGKHPFGNTYRRNFEGDYRCDDETVKRMLADQVEDVRDAKLLENFTFDDLHLPTFTAYRNVFKAVKPDHPWADLDHGEFLRSIGGWTVNRETKREGLTLAGVLMFGKLRAILDAVPHYVVDYQERPVDANADDDRRWIDRVTTDGTWSGNLYDFYRMVIQRLTRDLKVPFRLKGATRIDDTPVHEAIREALTNMLIHSNFTGRVSLYVVKRQDMMGFRNPGLMRVPLQQAIRGGQSDCRNRNLQKMFQLVGLAEQAGSGLPKVYRNWNKQHWRRPELIEQIQPEQTILRLRMLSLLPEEAITALDKRYGMRFRELPETALLALATVQIEGVVSHARMKEMTADHPKDLSKVLASLVEDGFLISHGATRATVYHFPDRLPASFAREEISMFDVIENKDSPQTAASSQHLGDSSQHLGRSSQHLAADSQHSNENTVLLQIAAPVRSNRKTARTTVISTIVALCTGRYLSAERLASLLNRDLLSLQNHYLRALVEEGVLALRFRERTHPQQAYTAAEPR